MDKTTNFTVDTVEWYFRIPTARLNNLCITDKALVINCVGHSVYANKINVSSSRLDYYCFYLIEGMVHIYEPIRAELRPGDVIIYSPKTHFRYSGDGHFTYYWAHFTGNAAEELLDSVGIQPNRIYHPGISKQAITNMHRMFEVFQMRAPLWEPESSMVFTDFILTLGKRMNPYSGQNDNIKKTEAFIQANLARSIQISALADMAFMSVSSFTVKFKKLYGMPPGTYINELRLNRASQLLLETDLSVKIIASQCGFEDPYYFSRMFHKKYQMGPREWRKKASSFLNEEQ